MSLVHIDYSIDKEKYQNIFWENVNDGCWHHSCVMGSRRELYWWRILIREKNNRNTHLLKFTDEIAKDLNIYGMDNYPRFNYYFPNRGLPPHNDPDNMVAININLFDTIPKIFVEDIEYPYECALINVGGKIHGFYPDPNYRLILKFCLRHPWDEVYERLDKFGLIIT